MLLHVFISSVGVVTPDIMNSHASWLPCASYYHSMHNGLTFQIEVVYAKIEIVTLNK